MVRPPAAAPAAKQAHRPVLRGGTLNIRGMSTSAAAERAARLWRAAGWDYALLQETNLTIHTLPGVARRLAALGWTLHAALSLSGRGGTAIAYRTHLSRSGAVAFNGSDEAAAVTKSADGRYTALALQWSGHRLQLASVYLTSGQPATQRHQIDTLLAPLARAAGTRQVLWGGDFNFVPAPRLDRLGWAGQSHPDTLTQRQWAAALPTLTDVWRQRHPDCRSFTFLGGGAASRLDRFYATPALLPRVAACTIGDLTTSDHRPVTLALTGLEPTATGPGLRRVRLGFENTPGLMADLLHWASAEVAAAPDDHHALLVWWPSLKRRLASQCRRLHAASRRLSAGLQAATEQLAALHRRLDAGDDSALADIPAARGLLAEAQAAAEADAALLQRQAWLHQREQPSPVLTRRLQHPRDGKRVAALRSPSGTLATSGTACAQLALHHYARVSAQPPVVPAAQQEVLAALATGRRLPQEQAAPLDRTEVTEQEVRQALKTTKPGKAPGHDGLPSQLYRRLKDCLAPLLARLFTAIATTGQLPPRFHEGLITIIYKGGRLDRGDPASYRPITLLCTDYRLWAKVLARRLNQCLPTIIDTTQTAFVPGRRIGENIMALQSLGALLRRLGRTAIAAFCDFRKAYDTIDRPFLLEAMAALGVGPGFRAMVKTLLTGTKARAIINGFISTPAAFAAGVRQGCPLAPLLYLFIGQALLQHLRTRGVGIDVAGCRLTALQYADDTQPLLPSLAQVPHLCAAMSTFGDASGQRLNPSKTTLLPLGTLPADLPPAAHGLTVVTAATSLGVTFRPDGTATADWPALLAEVERRYAKLAGVGLSTFGRGMASATYGHTKYLYHAEFAGHPPPDIAARLHTITSKLVDGNKPPASTGRRFAGIAGWLLPGRPAEGGFGALPHTQHITSRHAWWAARLLANPQPAAPWVAIARALLAACAGEVGSHPLGLLRWRPDEPPPGCTALLPEPLRRLHKGLAALPAPVDVAPLPLAPGPWCWSAPLWGNPLLRCPASPHGLDDPVWLDFADAGVTTLGQLIGMMRGAAAAAYCPRAHTDFARDHLRSHPAFANRHHTTTRIDLLTAALPPAWVAAAAAAHDAAAAGTLQPPSTQQVVADLTARLGWPAARGGDPPLRLAALKVRDGTRMLCAPAEARRAEQHLQPYAAKAGGTAAQLRAAFPRLWRLPWENAAKEPFWRLVYNAHPTAARQHRPDPCPCGAPVPDRCHHYWACPVAQAVQTAINACLAAATPAAPPVQKHQIWLALAPPGVHRGVWDVVCLAAVRAMDKGRRALIRETLAPPNPEDPTTPDALAARCGAAAQGHFWSSLYSFASHRRIPPGWQDHCPPTHPFLFFDPAQQLLTVHRPPGPR
jgi:exonuclease III